MSTEDDVAALAEKLEYAHGIKACPKCGGPVTLGSIIAGDLARVALGFYEKRERNRVLETIAEWDRATEGHKRYYPPTNEWLSQDEWRKRVFTEKGVPYQEEPK